MFERKSPARPAMTSTPTPAEALALDTRTHGEG